MDPQYMGEAAVGGLVVVKAVSDWIVGRARDRRHSTTSSGLREELATQFATLQLEVQQLRAFVVGPDGENGIRGDVREIKARVIGLEDRERQRLQPQQVGTYDRRGAP